jgi:NAD(P)-dependent dehydrogenase (short-subunit alcohol dehydrogenase family)
MAHRARRRAVIAPALALGALAAGRAWLRRRRRLELAGRVALVAGGSRGLGLSVARELGRRGAQVAICARDRDALERARADLSIRGVQALALPCDLRDRARTTATVEEVASRLGGLDVLVVTAGVIQVGPLDTMTMDDFDEALATNLRGPLHATLAAVPLMRARGGGRIVLVSSIGGKVPVPHLVPYTASKFAVGGLAEALRTELARDNILVSAVYPGLMRTGSPRHAFFKGRHRAEFAWFSIADSLPGLSMDAEAAARRIVDVAIHGDPHAVLSMPARLAALGHALLPGLTIEVASLVNRWLPAPGGLGTGRVPGRESESSWSPSWLTRLGDRAAQEHNQVAPGASPAGVTSTGGTFVARRA